MAESTREYLKSLGRVREGLKNVPNTPIGQVLKDFSEEMIDGMKDELAADDRNATGSLSSSLRFEINNVDGGVSVEFLANDYWDFINSGVNGVQNQFGSPYSFRSLNPSPQLLSSLTGTGSLRGWMAAKGITTLSYTDKDGNQIHKNLTTENDFKSAAWVFAKAIKRNGIKPSGFVDNVFNEERLDKLEEDLMDAFVSMLE